jgi:hypothetical protein
VKKPLSFSGYKRLVTCPKYYQLHDVEKLRPTRKSSALYVGTIFDEVINGVLLNSTVDPYENLKSLILKHKSENCEFFKGDYDADLLEEKDVHTLKSYANSMGWKGDNFDELIQHLFDNQYELSDNQYKVLSECTWMSLYRKLEIMVESYIRTIMPKIKEVHFVQKEISVTTPSGSIRGFVDFAATLRDGRKVLFDNKTSNMPYLPGAVLESPQLALYSAIEGYEYAGFIVVNKQITKRKKKVCSKCDNDGTGTKFKRCNALINKKRCNAEWDETIDPYSFIQIHVDKMPDNSKDIVMEALDETIKVIDNGVYPRNLNACFKMYGRPCPYMKYCWQKNKKGLKDE